MADTTYTDNVGPAVKAAWLNDINNVTYRVLGKNGAVPVDAATLRSNVGAAASGANNDITSLTGLTTALSIGQGGTGATTAGGARTSLAAAGLADNNVFTGNNTFNQPVVVPNATAANQALNKGQADGLYIPVGIQGAAKNSKISALGVNNYSATVTVDEIILENSSQNYYVARNVNLTVNANGTVGAPLSIMSARSASTWYYVWLWYNATNGLTATLDTSPTAPTAPTGYASTDYKARARGAVRTDSSGSTYLMQTETVDDVTRYVVTSGTNTANLPNMASGASGSPGTPTWVAVAVGAFVPVATARAITCVLTNNNSTSVAMVAPNNSYGAYSSGSNPPPLAVNAGTATGANTPADIMLESSNIYWASGGSATLVCYGWKDHG